MTKKRSVTRVPVINALDPQDCYDYILVFVRRNQVAALLPALARNGPLTTVFMGNNPSGPDECMAALGMEMMTKDWLERACLKDDLASLLHGSYIERKS